jgi:hypothetical protein
MMSMVMRAEAELSVEATEGHRRCRELAATTPSSPDGSNPNTNYTTEKITAVKFDLNYDPRFITGPCSTSAWAASLHDRQPRL